MSFSMDNDHNALMEQSKCDKAFFSIIETIVKNRDSNALKHLFDSHEIKSVFEEVGLALRFIPLKSHQLIVVTDYSYVKEGAGLTRKGLTTLALRRKPAWNVWPFRGGCSGDPGYLVGEFSGGCTAGRRVQPATPTSSPTRRKLLTIASVLLDNRIFRSQKELSSAG